MQKLEQLLQKEETEKNDLYTKQKARLASAKAELSAEEEEEKAQETVMKLQSQEREVRSTQIKTEEKLLAMQNGQTSGDKSDAKKSSSGFGDSGASNLRSGGSFGQSDNGGGFSFSGAQPQDNNQQPQQQEFNFGNFGGGGNNQGGGGFSFSQQ